MRTFDQYMEHQTLEPLVWKAASLMVELEIDPQEYLSLLVEWPASMFPGAPKPPGTPPGSFQTGVNNAGAGVGQAVTGVGTALGGVGQMGAGLVGGAWDKGSQAAGAMANSAVGKGIKGWWQDFNSSDRKLEKAADMIRKAMVDPNVSAQRNAQTVLTAMIDNLTQIARTSKAARRRMQNPAPAPAPGGGTPPPGPGTPPPGP